MKHLFLPYELALLAKEKGFDEPCLMAFYGENNYGQPFDKLFLPASFGKYKNSLASLNNIAAPLYQQIIDWLRVKHSIWVYCSNTANSGELFWLKISKKGKLIYERNDITFNSPQEAYSAAFDYVLNNLI